MFGATFVFPIVMGLDANLAIMMSGVATIMFLLIVQGRIPSYLGTSASFVGAVVAATPGGVLGGITVVLYGMVGLLGAKIWIENKVDFGNPLNLVPIAAGVICGIGNVTLTFTDEFSLTGIALGTLVTLIGFHVLRALAPESLKRQFSGGADGPAQRHVPQ